MDFTIKKCTSNVGLNVNPKEKLNLDLDKIQKIGKIIISTPRLVIVQILDVDTIIHRFGKIQFKKNIEESLIIKIVSKIYHKDNLM